MQTTLTQDPAIGKAGQLRYPAPAGGVITRFSEGATTAGLAVVAGTAAKDAEVPSAAFGVGFLGIVLYEDTLETNVHADKDQIAVVREGVVLVAYEPDTVPTPNTAAFARHTANGAGKLVLGAIRANVDSDNADPIPGGTFGEVFPSEGLVELRLAGTVN